MTTAFPEGDLGSVWCLSGSVTSRRSKERPDEMKCHKHFAPGAKVYALPAQWGDGFENIVLIGRHRSNSKFISLVTPSAWVRGWRSRLIYSPSLIKRLRYSCEKFASNFWESKDEIEDWVSQLNRRAL